LFTPDGHCNHSAGNFANVVRAGRTPGLMLNRDGEAIALRQWGHELLDGIAACAALLDAAAGGDARYAQAVAMQRGKLDAPDATPSGRFLAALIKERASFDDYARALSQDHARALCDEPLSDAEHTAYAAMARESLAEQARIEAGDVIDFDSYVARYHAALRAPVLNKQQFK